MMGERVLSFRKRGRTKEKPVAFGLFCLKCYLAKTFSGEFIILDGAFALFCLLSL